MSVVYQLIFLVTNEYCLNDCIVTQNKRDMLICLFVWSSASYKYFLRNDGYTVLVLQ